MRSLLHADQQLQSRQIAEVNALDSKISTLKTAIGEKMKNEPDLVRFKLYAEFLEHIASK